MRDLNIKLSALWAARMLSGLQGDSTRLHDREALQNLIAGTSAVKVTSELLLVMSIVFAIPIFMIIFSLTLRDKANCWANRCLGSLFAVFDFVFLSLALFVWRPFGYETVWAFVYPMFTVAVAWYAWKWPNQDRSVQNMKDAKQ